MAQGRLPKAGRSAVDKESCRAAVEMMAEVQRALANRIVGHPAGAADVAGFAVHTAAEADIQEQA